jgi:hypothetical protein
VGKVLSIQTRPYYAQVALLDPTVEHAYPDWGTGKAEAVFGNSAVAVETRPDHLGPVAVEVWTGEPGVVKSRRLIEEAQITVEGGQGLTVGSVTGDDLHPVQIPAGRHRVRVYGNQARGEVDEILFVFPDLK